MVKNPPTMQETPALIPGLIPGSGRSTGEGVRLPTPVFLGFPCDSAGKESACNAGDLGSICELVRFPGEGKATHSSIYMYNGSLCLQVVE